MSAAQQIEKEQVWEHRTHGHYIAVLVADGDRANIAECDVAGGAAYPALQYRRWISNRYLRRAYRLATGKLTNTW